MKNIIRIRGARTHNLKNIDLDLPRDHFIVLTGLSGSGKSSLALDTLYAEGQRRYVESLSTYARQFLSIMDKPDVDLIEGLSPAIAIEQKTTGHNPRSTVGTVTEIYDYLRLLYARVGIPRCPKHGIDLTAQTITQIVDQLLTLPEGTRCMILAPIVQGRKGEYQTLFEELRAQGFIRIRVNGVITELDSPPPLEKNKKHHIEVITDRCVIRPNLGLRLAESFETTLRLTEGIIRVAFMDDPQTPELIFSTRFACPECGYSLNELEPRLFSFNSPAGACPRCDGLGLSHFPDQEDLTFPFTVHPCPDCQGTRLRDSARHVFIAGYNLPEITNLSIAAALTFFQELHLPGQRGDISRKIIQEIHARLQFLINIGLDYLTLARSANTLSGGETQRIRLASQIGAGLVGVLYILDEPSIGLHQRDNARLIATLKELRDIGNTVIVVEHDEETIRNADYLVEIGPGAGIHGGEIIAFGTPAQIITHPKSLTGQYLAGQRCIPIPKRLHNPPHWLSIHGATGNNLKNLDVSFPLGRFTCITGVSGSGKSTLVMDTLYCHAARLLNKANLDSAPCREIRGLEYLDKVINLDQSPIGRTPRSNPATYTGVLTPIRDLFAGTNEARARGYSPGRFSFNIKGGRCEACQGEGVIKVEMHFLPDIYVNCEICQGRRYNRETLDIQYKGKNIADVWEMTIEEAYKFFEPVPIVAHHLHILIEVGLGYLKLGQPSTTLSGGEAQRVKLAKELSRRDTGRTLYILDEPTTGLHFYDIEQLLAVLMRLRDHGNTILVIEHNLEVIKTADWVIDIGPEGGERGGELIAAGTPEQIIQCLNSHTGRFLQPILARPAVHNSTLS